MTQREGSPARPIPLCPGGHRPRYMYDGRRLEAKGGHFIECRCSCTPKCATFDLAWAHWHKMHGTHALAAHQSSPPALPQLQLRLVGGTDR